VVSWTGVRERLAALSAADPELRRFGAGQHRYELSRPLPEKAVAKFEAQHAVTLPEEYRSFLLTVGESGAGPDYGLYRLGAPECRDEPGRPPGFLATPFPHTSAWNHPDDGEIPDDRYFDQRWITGSLMLCHQGCGAYYRLVVTGPERGRMWFDDRVSDGGISPCGLGFREWYLNWLEAPA
jgi:hypothetical protein